MVKHLTFLNWFGGKDQISRDIFPLPEHETYVEVFGGGGTVLLNKVPCNREVYNDINKRLVNCFRTLQNQWMELAFLARYKGPFAARSLFEKYKEESPDSLEDAFRFFYANKHSFSGKNCGFGGLHTGDNNNRHLNYAHRLQDFPSLAQRLKRVYIEQQDFHKLIPRFDAFDALFYLDPPYYQGGENYEKMFGNEGNIWTEKDFTDLWELCSQIQGKIIISIDKKIEIPNQRLYYQEVQRMNRASSRQSGITSISTEYIIRNFDPAKMIPQRDHARRIEEWCK